MNETLILLETVREMGFIIKEVSFLPFLINIRATIVSVFLNTLNTTLSCFIEVIDLIVKVVSMIETMLVNSIEFVVSILTFIVNLTTYIFGAIIITDLFWVLIISLSLLIKKQVDKKEEIKRKERRLERSVLRKESNAEDINMTRTAKTKDFNGIDVVFKDVMDMKDKISLNITEYLEEEDDNND